MTMYEDAQDIDAITYLEAEIVDLETQEDI